MTALFDPNAYTKWRSWAYMATAKYFFGPIYVLQNRQLTTEGRENVPDGPFVAVSNHLSNWDPPVLAIATDRSLAFLAKKELYDVPVLKSLILFYGAISIDREKPEVSTFKAVKNMFKSGWALGMFIEGTRNKNPGTLGQPHQGPAYFAKAYKVPIVPIGITGMEKTGQKAHAKVGKPMFIEKDEDLDEATWRIMGAIAELTGYKLPERKVSV